MKSAQPWMSQRRAKLLMLILIVCGGLAACVQDKSRSSKMPNYDLPRRGGDVPRTGLQPPQLQFSDTSPRWVYRKVADWLFSAFPKVREEPTRISVPGSRALWLDEAVPASASAFMPPPGSREFAHLHEDGSLHVVVPDSVRREILAKGWGLDHPWKDRGVNEVLVFAPRTDEEIEVIKSIVGESYRFATTATARHVPVAQDAPTLGERYE